MVILILLPFVFTGAILFLIPFFFIWSSQKRKQQKLKEIQEYESSSYFQVTKIPYQVLENDLGKLGEYLTYKYLRYFESLGAKFLFNVYIPKKNGERTEIDMLMITAKGVFVFESKNFSGWIFGDEAQRNWTQSLHLGYGETQKEHFYNPVMQNRAHMKHLQALIGAGIPLRSVVVFSERCTLKKIIIRSQDISVINRDQVPCVVPAIYAQMQADVLTESDIGDLYAQLYPYTQESHLVKEKHIYDIRTTTN